MGMPGRKFNAGSGYRYGFNGKENDNEVKGNGNQQDYGLRIYDPRLGRFLSVDPITANYPGLTPYQFASNRPIDGIDMDGLEFVKMNFPGSMIMADAMMRSGAESGAKNAENGGSFFAGYMKGSFSEWWNRLGRQTALVYGGGLVANSLRGLSFWGVFNAVAFNPGVQTEIVGTLAALAGYDGPDIPGPQLVVGQTFKRTWQEVKIVKQNGKVISQEVKATAELIMHEGASFATQAEKSMAQKLLSEGNTVEILAESKADGVRSADYLINGVKTELKTFGSVKRTDADHLSNVISQTLKRSKGQAANAILDVSTQNGASQEVVERGLKRYWGQNSSVQDVRVVGDGYDKTYKKSDFYPNNN